MNNKQNRQETIRQLIETGKTANQDELLALLRHKGFVCTQATLSRDLHELKVVKIPDETKGYVYVSATGRLGIPDRRISRVSHLSDGFRDLRFSGNLGVIRTLPGYASSIALAIHNADIPELLGTIAGDDTILVILKENVTKEEIKRVLAKTLPFIKNKI
jgi:transcriptional regulator of arginine metabolism